MRYKLALLGIVQLLFMISLASAATMLISAPEPLTQGQSAIMNLSLLAAPGFNGSLSFSYTNLDSTVTSVNFFDTSFQFSMYSLAWQVTPQQVGSYSVYAIARDSSNNVQATFNKTGTVTAAGPRILSASPSGSVKSSTIAMIVSTDIDSTCRFDSSDNSYEALANVFLLTGAKNHTHTLSGVNSGNYKYYVLCRDPSGKVSPQKAIIEFSVENVPSAKIKLKDPSPVKEGIIEVFVTTSKELPNAPTLQYTYNDKPTEMIKISLTGSGTEWQGYLVVTPLDNNKVGTFFFSGVDAESNTGTKITNSNLFIVDTTKPPQPTSIKATALSEGSVKINWYYDGEDVDYYNIYRTTASGVNYVDFYAKANKTQAFSDKSTLDKVTYFYRVAAVDLAGNEGPLSSETFATSLGRFASITQTAEENEAQEAPQVLSPILHPKVDAKIKEVDKYIIDVQKNIEDANKLPEEQQALLDKFGIKSKLRNADVALANFKTQLQAFKDAYATEPELDAKIKSIDTEIQKLRKTTPRMATLAEQTTITQSTAKEDVRIAAQESVKDLGLKKEETDEYIAHNEKDREDFKVESQAQIITVENVDGSTKEQTFITKRVSYTKAEELKDVIVVEIIPKKIASHASELTFARQDYEILNEDPIIKFGFLQFNYQGEEIIYSVDKRIDLEELKNAKTVVLRNPDAALGDKSSFTGFSVFPITSLGLSKFQSLLVWVGVLTIVSMLLYYAVFVKEYASMRGIRRGLTMSRVKSQSSERFSNYDQSSMNNRTQNQQDEVEYGFDLDLVSTSRDQAQLQQLLGEAEMLVQVHQKQHAAKLYPQIHKIYQGLPKEAKQQYYSQCLELHKMISRK